MSWLSALPIIGQGIDTLLGQRNQNTSPRRAGETAYHENQQGVIGRVEAAKSLGLHPLSVLGGSFGGSGAGIPATSNFGDFAARGIEEHSRNRQWKAENAMRTATEKRLGIEAANAQRLNQAQIKHIEKQSSWIDEQIAASQEQRLRETLRNQKAGTGRSGDGSLLTSPSGVMTQYKPHEVTRHVGGTTVGVGPGREQIMDSDGTVFERPHGSQAEQSELMNMLADFSAHYGIPLTTLTGRTRIRNTIAGGKLLASDIAALLRRVNKRAKNQPRSRFSTNERFRSR